MRHKLRTVITPYSFRAKTQVLLAASIIVACTISLCGSYFFTRFVLQRQIVEDEYSAALSILALEEKTGLSMEEIMPMVASDALQVRMVDFPQALLSASDINQLENRMILAVVGNIGEQPMTFVKTSSGIVGIFSLEHGALLANNFARTCFFAIMFSAVFALLSMLSSWRIARPVSQLTEATRQISRGNFDIQLPEDQQDEMG